MNRTFKIHRPLTAWIASFCVAASLTTSAITPRVASATCSPPCTLYVNNDPNSGCVDALTSGSIGTPFCKIQKALDLISGGPDTVLAVMGSGLPYTEALVLSTIDSGSVAHPFVLFARGAVTLEFADVTNHWSARPAGSVTLWASVVPEGDDCRQVIVDNIRYPDCDPDCNPISSIPLGMSQHFDYAGTADTVFAHLPSGDYTNTTGYLCRRAGLRVRAANVVIDGFTLLRSRLDGIEVNDRSVRNLTIKNCVIRQSADDGIDVTKGIYCTLRANTSSDNTGNGIFLKTWKETSAGDTTFVADCTIADNTSYDNNNQATVDATDGDINGIRIGNKGNGGGYARSGHHLITGNKTYGNEDTGIDVRGSHGNTFRYNQSWSNGDHGFDHLTASYNTHSGDLAYGNGADGLSVENDCYSTQMRNCVLANNARDESRQDYELEVTGAARDSFLSDYNVIYRESGRSGTCSTTWEEAKDTIVVAWRATDNQVPCIVRCPPDSSAYCFGTVARFAADTIVNIRRNEVHSKGKVGGDGTTTAGQFWDASTGDFRPKKTALSVDAADATVAGWPSVDLAGSARYDCLGITNTGKAGGYADIGPYEAYDWAPAIDVVPDYNTISVSWTARGEYGDVTTIDEWHIVRNDIIVAMEPDAPLAPPEWEHEYISATPCHEYDVYVMTYDHSGEWARSNTVSVTTCCSNPCEVERPSSGRAEREEPVDVPLGLGWPGANPSRGAGAVSWSFSRAQVDEAFDLSLFDVAGRRVATIASGTAKAGRFAEEVSFRGGDGRALANGVLFVRLAVGDRILKKTIVLMR